MSDLDELRQIVGARAFAALLRGSPLRQWRRTTPWNWWVENRKSVMLWHSTPEQKRRPDLRLFELKFQSPKTVTHYLHTQSEYCEYVLLARYQVKHV